jgi:hypothetical protein
VLPDQPCTPPSGGKRSLAGKRFGLPCISGVKDAPSRPLSLAPHPPPSSNPPPGGRNTAGCRAVPDVTTSVSHIFGLYTCHIRMDSSYRCTAALNSYFSDLASIEVSKWSQALGNYHGVMQTGKQLEHWDDIVSYSLSESLKGR